MLESLKGGVMYWYLKVLRQYVDFSGRARRKEYWMFSLFTVIISIFLSVIDVSFGMTFGSDDSYGFLSALYAVATFLPGLGVTVRRLHDTDRSGWWSLIIFIPLIGIIVLLIFMCLDSTPHENRFGPWPKDGDPYGLVVS